jgi:uncharacterized protein (TIGR02186 family)
MKRLLLALLFMFASAPAEAEKLVSTVSNPQVLITSSFDGTSLSLFGNIEADTPDGATSGPYNVIVVITGPLQDRVTRMKTSNFGIWSNTGQVNFKAFPSFYAVVASGKLDAIANPELLAEAAIRPEDQARLAAETSGLKGERFGLELVRLMSEENHFVLREDGVRFLSDTAYAVNITLPSDVANGPSSSTRWSSRTSSWWPIGAKASRYERAASRISCSWRRGNSRCSTGSCA